MPMSFRLPPTLRGALRRLSLLPVLAGALAACSSATPLVEDVGTTAEALSCSGDGNAWANFPYGPPGQQCVAGVIRFYQAQFGVTLNGSAGPCGEPWGNDGACNYWVTPSSEPSVRNPGAWTRHPWGSAAPQRYDLVVFKSYPSSYGTAFGHVASVDHVDGNGTLWVTDSNWNNSGHGECPHPVTWEPYGFYRLKLLEVPPAKGTLASATCQALAGSAEDPSAPGAAISVEFYQDGPKGSGASLGSALTGENHTFAMPTPLGLYDGRPHSIYAYAIPVSSGASEGLLTNAPAPLHCAAPLTGDFHGTGRDDIVEFRDDWTTLPSCGPWGSVWSCNNDAATYLGGGSPGNSGSGIFAGSTALVGDVNGDGTADVIEWNAASSSLPVCLSVGNGWACENLAAKYVRGSGAGNSGSGVFGGATALVGDVNGDGKADVIQFDSDSSTLPVCVSTDDGWACENLAATYVGGVGAGNEGSGVYAAGAGTVTTALVGDVNGDGRADLVQWNPSWSSVPECISTSQGWSCTNASATFVSGAGAGNSGSGVYKGSWVRLADVNGDGKDDLVQFDPKGSTIPVCFSTDRGWSCANLEAAYVGGAGAGNEGSGVYPATAIVTADLNGDGRADILQFVAGSASLPVCFSTGKGWSCHNLAIATGSDAAVADADAGVSPALPYGLPVVGRLEGDKGIAVAQFAPEGTSGLLRTCTIDDATWRCSNKIAALK